jgi:hypothetical protein
MRVFEGFGKGFKPSLTLTNLTAQVGFEPAQNQSDASPMALTAGASDQMHYLRITTARHCPEGDGSLSVDMRWTWPRNGMSVG